MIDRLLPGFYRIIAYPQGVPWMSDPDLTRRLQTGQEVGVGDGVAQVPVRTRGAP